MVGMEGHGVFPISGRDINQFYERLIRNYRFGRCLARHRNSEFTHFESDSQGSLRLDLVGKSIYPSHSNRSNPLDSSGDKKPIKQGY